MGKRAWNRSYYNPTTLLENKSSISTSTVMRILYCIFYYMFKKFVTESPEFCYLLIHLSKCWSYFMLKNLIEMLSRWHSLKQYLHLYYPYFLVNVSFLSYHHSPFLQFVSLKSLHKLDGWKLFFNLPPICFDFLKVLLFL